MSMFAAQTTNLATRLLDACRHEGVMLATAESCTGGLIAAALTEIAGSSDVFDRGYVTYSNAAKTEILGVKTETLMLNGAVSEQAAREMAAGCLTNSRALISIAVTGVAGPTGGSEEKPVGTIHMAVQYGAISLHRRLDLGSIGRSEIRLETLRLALQLCLDAIERY